MDRWMTDGWMLARLESSDELQPVGIFRGEELICTELLLTPPLPSINSLPILFSPEPSLKLHSAAASPMFPMF